MSKVFCSNCRKLHERNYTVDVHNYCENCKDSEHAQFMRRLFSGDPEIMEFATKLTEKMREFMKPPKGTT